MERAADGSVPLEDQGGYSRLPMREMVKIKKTYRCVHVCMKTTCKNTEMAANKASLKTMQ